jgi:hypothetical protein
VHVVLDSFEHAQTQGDRRSQNGIRIAPGIDKFVIAYHAIMSRHRTGFKMTYANKY